MSTEVSARKSFVTLEGSALRITSAQELLAFEPRTVVINRRTYTVLTGYEGAGGCFWCGGELKGKLQRYCYGHMKQYYRHFEWNRARWWCCQRQEWRCANCGVPEEDELSGRFSLSSQRTNLRVHHIIALEGRSREFSPFNLPWNLIGLCHGCHQDVHAAMRPALRRPPSTYEQRIGAGQLALLAEK